MLAMEALKPRSVLLMLPDLHITSDPAAETSAKDYAPRPTAVDQHQPTRRY